MNFSVKNVGNDGKHLKNARNKPVRSHRISVCSHGSAALPPKSSRLVRSCSQIVWSHEIEKTMQELFGISCDRTEKEPARTDFWWARTEFPCEHMKISENLAKSFPCDRTACGNDRTDRRKEFVAELARTEPQPARTDAIASGYARSHGCAGFPFRV